MNYIELYLQVFLLFCLTVTWITKASLCIMQVCIVGNEAASLVFIDDMMADKRRKINIYTVYTEKC